MGNEDASVRRRTGEWEVVYESSVPAVGCGEGESRRKNSYGDSLPLVECAADARFGNTSSSTGGFQGPLRKVFSFLPRQVVDGTEDAKVFAILNSGLRPLICSTPSIGGVLSQPLHFLQMFGSWLLSARNADIMKSTITE